MTPVPIIEFLLVENFPVTTVLYLRNRFVLAAGVDVSLVLAV